MMPFITRYNGNQPKCFGDTPMQRRAGNVYCATALAESSYRVPTLNSAMTAFKG